jgi:hypothetical protein
MLGSFGYTRMAIYVLSYNVSLQLLFSKYNSLFMNNLYLTITR